MKLVCVRSTSIGDWYLVERDEAPGEHREWFDPFDGYQHSGRISDACVEGTGEEILALASAIEAKARVEFRRCAVDATSDTVQFWSPRNSSSPGNVPYADALALAALIRQAVAK